MFLANIINHNVKYFYKIFSKSNIKIFHRKLSIHLVRKISKLFFREGSKSTPIHTYAGFRLKTYAQTAFRFFRNAFGVDPSSFMVCKN
jgi:hypothetical protein